MAEPSNDAVSRLMPSLSKSRFPSNDAVLVDKENAPIDQNGLNTTEFCLSDTCLVFPNDFDSLDSASSSPSASSLGSTETDTSDEEDFLAGLTQRLTHSSTRKIEKSWVASGSPQSTLIGLGSTSWSSNGSSSSLVPSPPTTPFGCEDDKRDLISAAADQIARLKMLNTTEPQTALSYTTTNSDARGGLLAPPRGSSPFHLTKNPDLGFYSRHSVVSLDIAASSYHYQEYVKHEEMLKAQSRRQQLMRPRTWATSQPHQMYDRTRSNYVGEDVRCGRQQQQQLAFQAAWAPSQKPQQQSRPIFVAGSGNAKRGTGVFLPRRYGNSNPHDERRRSGSPSVLSSTINNNNNNGLLQQRFNCCFDPHYDAMMMARRNAVISLQRRNIREEGGRNHEIHLPKEWTY